MKTQLIQQQSVRFPFNLVQRHLEKVEVEIRSQAKAFDPAVEGYVAYVCDTKGKRIRPALAVLAGGATGNVNEAHTRLGVILELIHVASLVHDDIMDGADMRREMQTANAKWGNALSVLLGDCLFAHALDLATQFDSSDICRAIAKASREVCSGEILQTQRRFDLGLTIGEYLKILEMKTAALFSVATHMGAHLNHAPPEQCRALHEYGRLLGIAYQIYDDCLDLVGKEAKVGKTLGTDLAKGKLTLPILNLLGSASREEKLSLNELLLRHDSTDAASMAEFSGYRAALARSIDFAQDLSRQARQHLAAVPRNEYQEALATVTHFLDEQLDGCRPAY